MNQPTPTDIIGWAYTKALGHDRDTAVKLIINGLESRGYRIVHPDDVPLLPWATETKDSVMDQMAGGWNWLRSMLFGEPDTAPGIHLSVDDTPKPHWGFTPTIARGEPWPSSDPPLMPILSPWPPPAPGADGFCDVTGIEGPSPVWVPAGP